jgi:4'-phosphopantetheinyl transferase
MSGGLWRESSTSKVRGRLTMPELWYLRTGEVEAPQALAAFDSFLNSEERRRKQAFRFEEHRHEYLVTRGLCRMVLARHVSMPPGDLRFRRNDYGRPEIDPPSGLRFNLSNTVAMVVCAVATGREIGVDAEPLSHADRILAVAERVYTSGELARLSRLEPPLRRLDAVRLWTLKEAYMKARGLGMSLPPQSFEIDLDAGGLALRPTKDDTRHWELGVQQIDDHIVATCVERGDGPVDPIAVHHAITLLTPRSPAATPPPDAGA